MATPALKRMKYSQTLSNAGDADKTLSSVSASSTIFMLQTEEMLHRVRLTYEKRLARVDAALQSIKQAIDSMPDLGPFTILEAEKALLRSHEVQIPFPDPPPDKKVKYFFSYARPTSINVIGSYSRKTAIHVNEILTIDLAVTMPTKIFQEKDYLNYRYFYKRAFYLARIAAGLRESKDFNFSIDYALQNDSHLQPTIIIKSNPGANDLDFSRSKCQIRILLAADGDFFPMGRTLLHKSCIRSVSATESSKSSEERPTPFYNSSLRSECCSLSYLELFRKCSTQFQAFNGACILGSVWLRQRGFSAGLAKGGFGPFEWAFTMAMLMRGGTLKDQPMISKGCNSYQMFKAVLLFLAGRDLMQTSASLCIEKDIVTETGTPILLDNDRGINILFKMSSCSYKLLRYEAGRTLGLLSDPSVNHIDACFITKIDDPMQRFDFLACFPINYEAVESLPIVDAIDEVMNVCARVHQVIKRGLDDRALLVDVRTEARPPWAVTATRSPTPQIIDIMIGLLLKPEHINRTVDRGPSAEDKVAASTFRTFWGAKAELRRFKDGSIVESLIWTLSPDQSVTEQIITHVLRHHYSDEAANGLRVLGKYSDYILPSDIAANPVALYQPILTAYEVFERQLRSLKGMPLQIHHVSAGDAQLRYTSPTAPWQHWVSSDMRVPADVYVQFEGSSRWPSDLAATQRTKVAFLLKIGELLQESASTSGVMTRLGLDNSNNDLSNLAFLDVSYPNAALFRLRIHHERELGLLKSALESATSSQTREAIVSALSVHKRTFVQSPLHTQAVRRLCTRFPILSPSIRLMKNWRESHLLSDHISDELIELLTIRNFVQPYPWAVPGSANTGFLRTLMFISKWNWRSDPLIVDLSGEMKNADYSAISTRFEAWRKVDPAMNRVVMFVASNLDPEGISWTEEGPSKVIAARLTSLARLACSVVKGQGMDVKAETLFASSLLDYDFVIHLNQQFIFKGADSRVVGKRGFKNLEIQPQQDRPFSNSQPVHSFVGELRNLYGSHVIFFWNKSEGPFIGGLWNPQIESRPWKVNIGYSTVPLKQNSDGHWRLGVNKAAMLHDIARLGGHLVSKIEGKD